MQDRAASSCARAGGPTRAPGRRQLLAAAAVLPWALLGGCASKPKPGDKAPEVKREDAIKPPSTGGLFTPAVASLGGEIIGAADLNPSASGRPSPLPLRLFELSAATAFNKADFLALYQGELQALGAELLAREELVLGPGEVRTMQRVLKPETRFIGVFGAFRSFERAVWRAVAPVQPGKKHSMQVRVSSLAVAIQLQVV